LPVENVRLKNVTADTVRDEKKYIQEHVLNFTH